MNMRVNMAAALLAIASFAADAQTVAPTAPATGADPQASTRKICRVSPANGSRLGGTRICRTADEWAQAQREARLTTERIQRVSPPCHMGSNVPGQGMSLVCSDFGP